MRSSHRVKNQVGRAIWHVNRHCCVGLEVVDAKCEDYNDAAEGGIPSGDCGFKITAIFPTKLIVTC